MKMFGSIAVFFYKYLAGITPLLPGYKKIMIKPQVVGDLTSCSASLETVHGEVSSGWEKKDSSLLLEAGIPVSCSATVGFPVMGMENVTIEESGRAVWRDGTFVAGAAGIHGAREEDGYVYFNVGSGFYLFQSVIT
jgi:alpha-L-rhamnosidase